MGDGVDAIMRGQEGVAFGKEQLGKLSQVIQVSRVGLLVKGGRGLTKPFGSRTISQKPL